jgi:hypothetical protein
MLRVGCHRFEFRTIVQASQGAEAHRLVLRVTRHAAERFRFGDALERRVGDVDRRRAARDDAEMTLVRERRHRAASDRGIESGDRERRQARHRFRPHRIVRVALRNRAERLGVVEARDRGAPHARRVVFTGERGEHGLLRRRQRFQRGQTGRRVRMLPTGLRPKPIEQCHTSPRANLGVRTIGVNGRPEPQPSPLVYPRRAAPAIAKQVPPGDETLRARLASLARGEGSSRGGFPPSPGCLTELSHRTGSPRPLMLS